MTKIIEALVDIQSKLKSPKDQNAGRYRYRNIEDINAAVKPLAASHGCAVIYSDEFASGVCVSTCSLTNGSETVSSSAFSVVNNNPKGMSIEQACASASTFARKAAVTGLFALDNSEKDPDRLNATVTEPDTKATDVSAEVIKAKRNLWEAVTRYAELNGIDPHTISDEIKARDDYRETRAYLNKVASEYRDKCNVE